MASLWSLFTRAIRAVHGESTALAVVAEAPRVRSTLTPAHFPIDVIEDAQGDLVFSKVPENAGVDVKGLREVQIFVRVDDALLGEMEPEHNPRPNNTEPDDGKGYNQGYAAGYAAGYDQGIASEGSPNDFGEPDDYPPEEYGETFVWGYQQGFYDGWSDGEDDYYDALDKEEAMIFVFGRIANKWAAVGFGVLYLLNVIKYKNQELVPVTLWHDVGNGYVDDMPVGTPSVVPAQAYDRMAVGVYPQEAAQSSLIEAFVVPHNVEG